MSDGKTGRDSARKAAPADRFGAAAVKSSSEAAAEAAELRAPEPAPDAAGLRKIGRLARAAERRMRLGRALDAGTTALVISMFGAAIVLAYSKVTWTAAVWPSGLPYVSIPVRVAVTYCIVALPFVVALVAWFRRLPPMAGAIALDKQAGLADRLATALAFAEVSSPTGFQRAAINDGIANVDKASPRKAVVIPVPRDLIAVFALAGVIAVIAVLEVRNHTPVAHTPQINALEVEPDDLEALQDFAREMQDHAHTPEMQAVVQEFNQLVEDLKNKHIDRNEAFKRMSELDMKLQKQNELDKKALDEAMKKLGDELKKNELTKDVGEALTKGDKKEAEKKLKELSDKLKKKEMKLSDEQKKALADALKKATSRDREKALAEMKAAREKLEAELEKMRAEKEKNGGKETPEMEKDRKNKEKELERLDREEKEQASADRQLAKLDRDLDQAAADLLKDLGLTAADLESGAEDVNRMAEDEMTDDEKEALRQRLKELHDLLVQQGKLSPEQIAKMKEFVKKARGSGKGGKKKKPGKPGGKFQPPEGDPSEGEGEGEEKDGEGEEGDGPPKGWTLGPNGEPIPMPGSGAGTMPGGTGEKPGGKGAGVGHDDHPLGAKTSIKASTIDTQIAGQAAGKGPSRSQTILGAADKGFVGQKYKEVYDQYKTVAEQTLKSDEIPAGYRFYVRRYFDLIRPRE